MSKLRHKDIKKLAQCHTAKKCWSWTQVQAVLAPEFESLTTRLHCLGSLLLRGLNSSARDNQSGNTNSVAMYLAMPRAAS